MNKIFKLFFAFLYITVILNFNNAFAVTSDHQEKTADFNFVSNFVPERFGTIDSFKIFPESKVFILINDFHYNWQAQQNTANILDHLVTTQKYNLIFSEGGTGDLTLSHLRPLAPSSIRKDVAYKFLEKGYISGEEYLDISSNLNFIVYGLEEENLYSSNVDAFFKSQEAKKSIESFVFQTQKIITKVKNEIYSSSLIQLDKYRRQYQNGKISIEDYCFFIHDFYKKQNLTLPESKNFSSFITVFQYLSIVPDSRIRAEAKDYCGKVKELSKNLDLDFGELFLQISNGNVEQIIHIVNDLHAKTGIDFLSYNYLNGYIDKVQKFQAINFMRLHNELNELEKVAYTNLLKLEDQRKIYALSNAIDTFNNLITLKLTRKEYIAYKSEISNFQPSLWIVTLLEICSNNFIKVDLPSIDFITYKLLDNIDLFYRIASKRDDFFLVNLEQIQERFNIEKSVIVVGGFHKDSFIDYFEETQKSYIVVSPKFDDAEYTSDYGDIFRLKQNKFSENYLDIQATKGTQTETLIAARLREAFLQQNHVTPKILKAITEGRAIALKDIKDIDINTIFSGSPEEIAVALTSDFEGITEDLLVMLASRLRGPPGEELIKSLKKSLLIVQEMLIKAEKDRKDPNVIADKYIVILGDGSAEQEFIPENPSKSVLRSPAANDAVVIGLNTLLYGTSNNARQKLLRRVLVKDALNINTDFSLAKGKELKELTLFWRGIHAQLKGIPHREFNFRTTSTSAETTFFVQHQDDLLIVENLNDPTDIISTKTDTLNSLYYFQKLNDKPRKNVSILPFFADGVGSSIRWIHSIRGIKRKAPDEYLSIVLFDLPQNRNFTAQQLDGVVDEIIWLKPEMPLTSSNINIMSHFRIKNSHRVLWEFLIQNIIDMDPNIEKAYAFELFVPEYDFSANFSDVTDNANRTSYASSFFEMKRHAQFTLTQSDQQVADEFYEKLGFNPEEETVIAYSLRLDMNLTDAVRHTNLYDTIKFIKLLQEKTVNRTGKKAKIIFFGNSPKTFADQLLDELARIEHLSKDEDYLNRIRSLTRELVNETEKLKKLIDDDSDLIDFTNAWMLKHNEFKRTFTLNEQAAVLGRSTFATGTNSGALDIPFALGVPGVRLTEYHYLGYNEFLAKDLTINIYTPHNLKSTKSSFIHLVANRSDVETFLTFLTSTPIQNDPLAVDKAYDEMFDYIKRKRTIPNLPLPKNIYHVKRNNDIFIEPVNIETNPTNRYPTFFNTLMHSFSRWGVLGTTNIFSGTEETENLLSPQAYNFVFPYGRSYPELTIPVYFGVHSLQTSPIEPYFAVIPPEFKMPYKQTMRNDEGIRNYLYQAEKIFIWSVKDARTILSIYPELKSKIVMADEAAKTSTARLLSSIPSVKADTVASQLIFLLEDYAGQSFRSWDDYIKNKHFNIIKNALDPKNQRYLLNHVNDITWSRELIDLIVTYYENRKDDSALDYLNYVGIWLVNEKNQQIDEPVPFLFTVTDYYEIAGENIKRGYGANVFLSQSALYKSFLAIAKGAPIEPLAELLSYQARIVKKTATEGYDMNDPKTSENFKNDVLEERALIENFMSTYQVVVRDINIGFTPLARRTKSIFPVSIKTRELVESSL